MNANGHTSGRWFVNWRLGPVWTIGDQVCRPIASIDTRADRSETKANACLIEAARTAPHECEDPACSGNVNRRKLEAFDGLLVVYELLTTVQTIRDFTIVRDLAHAAIAKAKAVGQETGR